MEEIRTEQKSGGIAIGKAVLLKQPDLAAERRDITAAEAEKEQAAFRRAAEQVREALRPLARTNAIFAAHLDMAEDATLLQGVEEKIAAGKNAEWALEEETEELSGMLESLEDAYLRERAADVRDVCRRMMAALKGVSETSLRNITEKVILFADQVDAAAQRIFSTIQNGKAGAFPLRKQLVKGGDHNLDRALRRNVFVGLFIHKVSVFIHDPCALNFDPLFL